MKADRSLKAARVAMTGERGPRTPYIGEQVGTTRTPQVAIPDIDGEGRSFRAPADMVQGDTLSFGEQIITLLNSDTAFDSIVQLTDALACG